MKTNILVDFSWFYYSRQFAFQNMNISKSGVIYNVGACYGIFTSIVAIIQRFPDCTIYLCLDGKPHKKEVVPTYKANREADKDSERGTISVPYSEIIEHLLHIPNVKVVAHENMEADDVIAFMASELPVQETKIIYSTDFDLRQMVSNENKVYSTSKMGPEGFVLENEDVIMANSGLRTYAIPMYKTICGDEGDNYFGIPRFPRALGIKLANNYPTLQDLKNYIKTNPSPTKQAGWIHKLAENWKLLESNYYLAKIDPENIPTVREKTSKTISEFDDFCIYYGQAKVNLLIKKIL